MSQSTTVTTYQGYQKTVTHQSVLYSVARRMGFDTSSNLESNVALAYLTYIDQRCREAWELYDWTEFIVDRQCAFQPAWNPTSTYVTGNIVFDWTLGTLNYYKALQSVPANTPVTNITYWSPSPQLPVPLIVPTYGQLSQAGSGATFPEIGTIFGVYRNDPYQNQYPSAVPFNRTAKGVLIFPYLSAYSNSPVVLAGGTITYPYLNLNTVFILYRQPYPGFATDAWLSTISYTSGNLAYYGTDTYQLTGTATVGLAPTSDLTNWTLVPFPYILSEFCKEAAYCDALIEDGQQQKAQARLPEAYARLMNEFDKQTMQQGLTQRFGCLVSPGNSY